MLAVCFRCHAVPRVGCPFTPCLLRQDSSPAPPLMCVHHRTFRAPVFLTNGWRYALLHIALMTISTYQHTIVSRHCFSGLLIENREQFPVRYIFGESEVNRVDCPVLWQPTSGFEYVGGLFTNFRYAFFTDNKLFACCSRSNYCEQQKQCRADAQEPFGPCTQICRDCRSAV